MTTKAATRVTAQDRPLDIISRQLETYAQRGVFRSYSQNGSREHEMVFRFYWLWNLPFHVIYHNKRKALEFHKLFPNVIPGSDVEKELKTFIKEASSADRPEHRRLDPRRVTARYRNRRNTGSLEFQIAGNHYECAVKQALNLVSEIFVGFLNVRHPEYMMKNFRMPEET
jgi:hypothetical protein